MSHKPETFEERRGKYVISWPANSHAQWPKNLHININKNSFHYIGLDKQGMKKATFSFTATDDGQEVYFDMENCDVYPTGYVDKIFDDMRRHKNINTAMSIIIASLLVSKFILLAVIFT